MDLSELLGLIRPRNRREAISGIGTAIASAAICWYFGVDVWHAILLGCAVTVIRFAVTNGASVEEFRDVDWRHRGRVRGGSRNDIVSLAHSLRNGVEPIGLTAERRLHQIARRRLALEGLDVLNPEHRQAIERRLGTRAFRVLFHRPGRRPRLRSLVYCLDVLDTLDPAHYAPPQPRRHWRLPNLITSNPRRIRER